MSEHVFVMSVRSEVQKLLANGLTLSEIARRSGVARSTVEYHAERLTAAQATPSDTSDPPRVRTHVRTRQRVTDLLAQGLTRAEIAKRLGLAKATVSYHARRAGAPVDSRCARRYDWAAIQGYYDQGHSLTECKAQFEFSPQTWHAAVQRGAIIPRPTKLPSDEFFVAGVYRNRTYLKLRLVKEGHREAKCEICGISEWRSRPLSVSLHHINGDRDDNRMENLQLLGPNCHSQTDSFSGRNGHRRRAR